MKRILEIIDIQTNREIEYFIKDSRVTNVINEEKNIILDETSDFTEMDALTLLFKNTTAGYALLSELGHGGSWIAKFLLSGIYGFRELEDSEMMFFVKMPEEIMNLLENNIKSLDDNLRLKLGYTYYHGSGVQRDFKKTLEFLLPLVKKDNKNAILISASIIFTFNYKDHVNIGEKLVDWAMQMSDEEVAEAQLLLSELYLEGQGVENNEEKAKKLIIKAANQGLAEAQYELGNMYLLEGEKEDLEKAAFWHKKAAEQEYGEAIVSLGKMYLWGEGVQTDKKKAMQLFLKAAERGMEEAYDLIGEMYHMGEGVTHDYQKAKEWYIKSKVIFDSYKGEKNLEKLEKGQKLWHTFTFTAESNNWEVKSKVIQFEIGERQTFIFRYKGPDIRTVGEVSYNLEYSHTSGIGNSGLKLSETGYIEDELDHWNHTVGYSYIVINIEWDKNKEQLTLTNK